MWERYHSPASLDEALALLNRYGAAARIVAGATDLLLEIERGSRSGIADLIDITRIPGLDMISLGQDGFIHLGPLTTHNHVVGSALLRERALPLVQACWSEAAPQIRNRATVAGNLITASPANDSITPLRALDTRLTLRSVQGERVVTLAEFYSGVRRNIMRPDEILTDIALRPLSDQERGIFLKLGLRRAQAISVVNLCAVLRFDGERVADAQITLGSAAPTIINATEAEQYLPGKTLTEAVIREAAELSAAAAQPIDDIRGSAAYRREMLRVLAKRALTALRDGSQPDNLPQDPAMLWGSDQGRVLGALPRSFTHEAGSIIETTINGQPVILKGAAHKNLLRAIRENAGLTGTKEGCAEGECGACTVILDGVAVMSCLVPAPRAEGARIDTVEGLAQDGQLHPIQQAFIEEAAVQCGYCTPGFLMAGASLLAEHPQPSTTQIAQSITGNLCRCTGYYKILRAFERAAKLQEEGMSS